MTNNKERLATLQSQYDRFREAGLKLDLTRGKPAPQQLDLSNELDGILDGFYLLQDGTDVRNYGGILGIPEARKLGAELLDVDPALVMAGGNSSLALMFEYARHQMTHWQPGDETIRFLCPVPGYDRHFTVCKALGIEMINIPLLDSGPDMDAVEAAVAADPDIKGIWCVPKYSNPTGITYSDETVQRLAKLPKTAGAHLTVFWDNAYLVHDLEDTTDPLANIFQLAEQAGTADGIVMFASTSKITFAGAGVAFVAASGANLAAFEKHLSMQMIGFDKINQLRHVRFLKDRAGVIEHMEKHRSLIKPKFDLVLDKLDAALGGKDLATWTRPRGGYFISL
ncbi:MAG: aminotransferase class I/II-fold pyridoxal phosphate-dependent enzyme, partial [Proteobacteria bacterium]|nr:aminotransferase class I/II-fold pyridoxal phosphate-dependent enzyme [Pseudomonadota bacterium]